MKQNSLSQILVSHKSNIKETIKTIDKGGKQIALVVDEQGKLLGTVTDGDIRRAILQNIDFDSSITNIMNKDYIYLYQGASYKEIRNTFEKNKMIHQIPLLDENDQVIDLILLDEIFNVKEKENYVILMAGGLGTRLRPLTDDTPKPMLTVGNKPILELIINQFKEYGYKNILISVNYKREIIESYFGDGSDYGVNIEYLRENKRLGTAGALKLAQDKLNDKPFFVMNGDVLTQVDFSSFIKFHQINNFDLTMGTKKYEYEFPYGVVNMNGAQVKDLEEKPKNHYFINAGIYCLSPEMIDYIPYNKYFDITDVINLALKDNKKIGSFPIREYWLDIGQKEDYYKAQDDYKNKLKNNL